MCDRLFMTRCNELAELAQQSTSQDAQTEEAALRELGRLELLPLKAFVVAMPDQANNADTLVINDGQIPVEVQPGGDRNSHRHGGSRGPRQRGQHGERCFPRRTRTVVCERWHQACPRRMRSFDRSSSYGLHFAAIDRHSGSYFIGWLYWLWYMLFRCPAKLSSEHGCKIMQAMLKVEAAGFTHFLGRPGFQLHNFYGAFGTMLVFP
ncbi:hypothetical protein EMIHUDRAFT_432080 [Emiliania huxleyi CCMP1516]|uniref:Uncharacterized protein n=2 Tax=Emiliania huxleyi TaxID=2903 RepID=A0A0D3JHD1_EMIH1|nr:hypothetical protein EMIHUDRAFT_432080 [Emiliania huxleyi CCMP1516]EOD22916.1 hypothetical protein EMIHUDRAFT_432080 [Emiliania huxleyi CCMP1516]|eukprot:XP_005775345.1 hypothetical protein EMIHUDRAFT_432080 [Emiliania huxleyi CCMP1516]